jgi:hypothetical protein
MGRIRALGGRRGALLGIIAVAGLVVAGCVPFKEPPPAETPALPNIQICAPGGAGRAPALEMVLAPGEPAQCVPFCLPGEEPTPQPSPFVAPGPDPGAPSCVPICLPGGGLGGGDPQMNAAVAVRCVSFPVPCLPGQQAQPDPARLAAARAAVRGCVNFCIPGQEPPTTQVSPKLARDCVPLCVWAEVIRGLPGLDPCPASDT